MTPRFLTLTERIDFLGRHPFLDYNAIPAIGESFQDVLGNVLVWLPPKNVGTGPASANSEIYQFILVDDAFASAVNLPTYTQADESIISNMGQRTLDLYTELIGDPFGGSNVNSKGSLISRFFNWTEGLIESGPSLVTGAAIGIALLVVFILIYRPAMVAK